MSETQLSAKAAELSVCIGLPTGATLPWQTALSLAGTTRLCAQHGIPIDVACIAGASIVTEARAQVVDAFLQGDFSRLFWVDSDIEWHPQDFLRMLVLSSEMDVVCGTYPRKRDDARLTIKHPDLTNFESNRFGCVKIDGTGLGFAVMKREVIEKLAAGAPRTYDEVQDAEIAEIFRVDTVPGPKGRRIRRGEDMAFFADVRQLGYDIWLDPSIKLGHVGAKVYRQDVQAALGLERQ